MMAGQQFAGVGKWRSAQMAQKIAIIIRPKSDRAELDAYRRGVDGLRAAGHRVRPYLTFESGDAVRFARAAARWRSDLVIAAGGDGTVNEVVNGIAPFERRPRLGIIPAGTANDFAAGLELPTELDDALNVAVNGRPERVDIARVNDRYFVNVSTGGFGAEASGHAAPEVKRRLGAWAYVITGVRTFVDLRPGRARFETDRGVLYEGSFLLFAVGNARRTGGGSRLTPRAEFGDGKLDLMLVPAMPMMDFLALLPDLRAGTHIDSPDVRYQQSPYVRVEAASKLSVNADGEPLRGRRFDYRLVDRPLAVMVP